MMILPRRARGRSSAKKEAQYLGEVDAFCERILQIRSTLDFAVSARGWGYILEEYGLVKGELDAIQKLINDCRKSGNLPLDICADDDSRSTDNLEEIDTQNIEDHAQWVVTNTLEQHEFYNPFSFWDDQNFYIEMWVEKIDLKNLFAPVCAEFHVPLANTKGWNGINSRAALMQRFAERESAGMQCVLLYCGDHDPGGLAISEALRSNLADLSTAVGWSPDDLIIDRFGLNFDFIEDQGLTWINNLETSAGDRLDSPRHADHFKPYVQSYLQQFGARKVEANALVVRPEAGRELCRQAIFKYLPGDAISEFHGKLGEAREALRAEISRLMNAVRP